MFTAKVGVVDSVVYFSNAADYIRSDGQIKLYGSLGTRITKAINIFLQHLGLDYLGITIVFSIFSFIGILLFYSVLNELAKRSDKDRLLEYLAPVMLAMLPSMHYFTSRIGKDALSFLAVNLLLFVCLNFSRRVVWVIFIPLVYFMARPYLSAIAAISLIGFF